MKKWQTCLLGVGSICCLAACSAKNMSDQSTMKEQTKTEQVSSQTATKGQAVADFELTGVDGKTYRLSDYKGKKVYLKFWASWCGPCKKSMPELMELAAKPDRDFEILSVIAPGIQGEKTVEQFPQWFQDQGYKDIPVLYDTKATTFQAYQIRSIPTEYLIDSQGKIGKIQFGVISNADAEAAFKEMN